MCFGNNSCTLPYLIVQGFFRKDVIKLRSLNSRRYQLTLTLLCPLHLTGVKYYVNQFEERVPQASLFKKYSIIFC